MVIVLLAFAAWLLALLLVVGICNAAATGEAAAHGTAVASPEDMPPVPAARRRGPGGCEPQGASRHVRRHPARTHAG